MTSQHVRDPEAQPLSSIISIASLLITYSSCDRSSCLAPFTVTRVANESRPRGRRMNRGFALPRPYSARKRPKNTLETHINHEVITVPRSSGTDEIQCAVRRRYVPGYSKMFTTERSPAASTGDHCQNQLLYIKNPVLLASGRWSVAFSRQSEHWPSGSH